MSSSRVLIVAHKTAATPALIAAVADRAQQGQCTFTLLVPNVTHGLHRVVDPEDQQQDEAQAVIALARPLLEEAAGGPVDALVGDPSPLTAIEDAVHAIGFDEIIVSTLPRRVSRWLHIDLPSKLQGLGLPVTTVVAGERRPVAAE